MAEDAALCLGLSLGQAARFGASTARHLAASRDAIELSSLLVDPIGIVDLTERVDSAIEEAALQRGPILLRGVPSDLLKSFLEALPCFVGLRTSDAGLHVLIVPGEPSRLDRPERIDVPDELWANLEATVARAENRTTRGAGLMEL